jgi:hypothetical protein
MYKGVLSVGTRSRWAIASVILMFASVLPLVAATPAAQAARATGEIALYDFTEGSGTAVNDTSGFGTPLDLTIATPGAVSWLPGGGLSINAAPIITSSSPATKILNAVAATNAITVEAWVTPDITTVTGTTPKRIVTISGDATNRNVTLGQAASATNPNNYNVRLRTSTINNNGTPPSITGGTPTAGVKQHVVYTRNSSGVATLYIDGALASTGSVTGTLTNWDPNYVFALGDEIGGGGRHWLGDLCLVAVYDTALTAQQVADNYEVGCPTTSFARASVGINAGEGISATTFSGDAFEITNTGTVEIESISVNLATGFFPDLHWDPIGGAGDNTAVCLTPFGGSDPVGFVAPADPCSSPFSVENVPDGYKVVSMDFTDFDSGEYFAFTADVDPYSINGFSSAGNAGAISGLEAAGVEVTIDFADGSTHTARTFGDGSAGGSTVIVPNPITDTVTLGVSGVTLAPAGFSGTSPNANGAQAAYVTNTSQTAVITGPSNTDVTLIVVNANLEDAPAGGFFELDPFERNKAQSVTYLSGTTNGSGVANIPFNVTNTPGQSTYLLAATNPAGIPSAPVYLEFEQTPSEGGSAFFSINANSGIDASTFSGGSFVITNTGSENITSLSVDLDTAFFPDVHFDPTGLAGDQTAGCFVASSGAATVGLVAPADPCVSPYSGGSASDGYSTITLNFTDFNEGETFTFTSDVDPLSITGYNSAGNAGAISGLELAGTTVTVNFADGTQESQTFGDGSQGGSDALVPTGIPATVSLEVQGVTLGGTGFSNGARGAFVTDTAQTAVVSGPAGTNVTLIVVNANMEDEPAGGFRDVDPFEQNKAQTVTYLNAVVGAGGSVNIPFTVTSNAGWSTYLIAAADDTAGSTVGISGIPTTPVYLEIGDGPSVGGSAFFSINANSGIDASTFSGGSFVITNTGSENITSLSVDLDTAFFPDVHFDPTGLAGDQTAGCFVASSGAATVGLVAPADPCVSPYSGGSASDGYSTITLNFTDFNEGETFTFTSDVDPLSITGYNSAGNAGAISGLELAGTTVTVNFADGTQESQTFGDGSQGGSDALVPTGIPETVTLGVLGVALSPTGFSNGATAATVTDASQTAVVSGPAGTNVTLIVVNANMEDEPAGGFRDVDPFEQNKAQTVTYLNAVVGAGGSVNIPFTVTSNAGWSTYLMAAADDTAGSTVGISGIPTTPVYLEIGDGPPAGGTVLYRVNAGGPQVTAGDASTPPWSADQSVANAGGSATTGTPSPYVNSAESDHTYGANNTIAFDSSVPPQAQVQSLFQTERYDAPPATTAAEMQWTFPAASGVTYTVNLYFAEIFTGTQSVGARVFDVTIEDVLVLNNYDVFADVGANTGVMKSFQVNLADDFIDIDFDRVTENPAIKAIEILAAGEEASGSIPAGGVLTTDTEADGATASDPVETTITMPSAGGPYDGTILEGPINVAPPSGFEQFGQQSNITLTPNAPSASDPFEIMFELHSSILPPNPLNSVTVFKSGSEVPECTGGANEAAPDPCEIDREILGNGNLQITILTTTASPWTFGFEPPVDLEAAPASLAFTDVVSGSTASQNVVFTNTGAPGSPILISNAGDIAVTGDAEFSADTAEPFPISLDGGESFTVSVDYAPTAPGGSHAASLAVTYSGGVSPSVSVPLTGTSIAGPQPGDPLVRINAGGPLVAATDTGPDWEADTGGANHPYLSNAGSNGTATGTVLPDGSVPSYVPGAVWGTERWSSSGFAYDIPVSAGTPVYVNLYMGNQCECTNTAGARQFDVLIDGNLVLDNLDLTGTYGHQVGHLFQFEIISDGTIDVDFVNVVENPLLNALEISLAGPQPNVLGISQPSIDFGPVLFASGSESQVITLTNLGETGDPSIEVSGIAKTGSAEFTLTGLPTLPLTLAPGASDTFNVVYDPVDAGFDVGTVTITHTGDNGPTSTIDLEGEGVSNLPVAFGASGLPGVALSNPTSLEFGPDDRLYVSQQNGTIKAYDIVRNGPNNYAITETETINLITDIQNHNDDGTVNNTKQRQVTGLMTAGTALNPELYVTSSDWRIAVGDDSNLDTNSGVLSKLTWNGTSWDHVQIVRGLPRSEENHSTNGLDLDEAANVLYVMSGGNTNKGAPSNNFSGTPEYALSCALLSVDLDAIEAMAIQVDGHGNQFIYDLPTLDDPTRAGDPDAGDPFGGNDGLNQAIWDLVGPVQVYSPGYRNAYDVVFTSLGRLYTFDNGPNGGWGGLPINEGTPTSPTRSTRPTAPGTATASTTSQRATTAATRTRPAATRTPACTCTPRSRTATGSSRPSPATRSHGATSTQLRSTRASTIRGSATTRSRASRMVPSPWSAHRPTASPSTRRRTSAARCRVTCSLRRSTATSTGTSSTPRVMTSPRAGRSSPTSGLSPSTSPPRVTPIRSPGRCGRSPTGRTTSPCSSRTTSTVAGAPAPVITALPSTRTPTGTRTPTRSTTAPIHAPRRPCRLTSTVTSSRT